MSEIQETAEEKRVREFINEAKEKIRQIDEASHPKGPAPQPYPPGGKIFMGPGTSQKILDQEAREHANKAIRQEALDKSSEAIKGAPVNTQAKAYRIADDFAYPDTARQNNPALNKGKEKEINETQRSAMHLKGHTGMKARHHKQKDISESQDYAMRNLGDEKEKNTVKSTSGKKEQTTPPSPGSSFKGASMSKQFEMSLSASQLSNLQHKTNKESEKTEAKKPMSISGIFSGSLGYNQLSDSHNPPQKANKEKGRDMDKD